MIDRPTRERQKPEDQCVRLGHVLRKSSIPDEKGYSQCTRCRRFIDETSPYTFQEQQTNVPPYS